MNTNTNLTELLTYRDITIPSDTYGSKETGSITIPSVSGYVPISAKILGGSRDDYAVQFLCSITTGYVRVLNVYQSPLTVSLNIRIYYFKNIYAKP